MLSANRSLHQLTVSPTLPFDASRPGARFAERGTQTVEETARRYGISRGVAYELARRGELPGVIRLGRRLVVARAVTDPGPGPSSRFGSVRGQSSGRLIRTAPSWAITVQPARSSR
ncbi:MAG: helix-turn-helix domain-containing protein [Candidatus Dormiibacterota bacterium]